MRERIAAVERFLRSRPGMIGIVLRDRTTGAVWRNKYAGSQIYLASTSKLGIAVTLLMQDRAGVIHLSGADRAELQEMLHVSSDTAADDLWFKYGASFYTSFFPRIGLTTVHYLPMQGVTGPYWGEVTGTPDDLDRLINYVLGAMPGPLRGYLVGQLRHVGTVQHFGVWGAGPANQPGNKDGWSVEQPGWIIDSVGFAGPGARYTLTMMNSLEGQGNYTDGTDTVTQVAAILFQGHQIPAPTLRATP
ncbi:MAG TPA: tat pathway signal sequence [Streptosporangiaceae bacterium]|nr:tat pathway signal sequence [Streptosporangiaceae bacterium]